MQSPVAPDHLLLSHGTLIDIVTPDRKKAEPQDAAHIHPLIGVVNEMGVRLGPTLTSYSCLLEGVFVFDLRL